MPEAYVMGHWSMVVEVAHLPRVFGFTVQSSRLQLSKSVYGYISKERRHFAPDTSMITAWTVSSPPESYILTRDYNSISGQNKGDGTVYNHDAFHIRSRVQGLRSVDGLDPRPLRLASALAGRVLRARGGI